MAMELRKMSIDYERRRMQLQVHYGNLPILDVFGCLHLNQHTTMVVTISCIDLWHPPDVCMHF